MVTEHGLSDRKLKILYAIIRTYLETGERLDLGQFLSIRIEPEFCNDSQ